LLSFLGPIMGLPKDGAFDSQLKIGIVWIINCEPIWNNWDLARITVIINMVFDDNKIEAIVCGMWHWVHIVECWMNFERQFDKVKNQFCVSISFTWIYSLGTYNTVYFISYFVFFKINSSWSNAYPRV
jgi:hypothetical protein